MGVKELSQTNTELFEICRKNDVEKLTSWISLKRTKRPRTPLNFLRPTTPNAAWLASIRDPNSQYTALHTAALHGYEAICRLLLDNDALLSTAKDKRGCIPLHLAAWNGHIAVVKLLCEVERASVDCANNAQETALHLAAQHGHSRVVHTLLDFGADSSVRNARCETPLDIAARTGHAAVCKALVTVCPELALQSAVECASTEENGRSAPMVVYPVHAAARHSHIQCLQMLRLSGFDLNYVTDEGSALHVAAMFGQVEAVKYLLEEGINPHIKDSRGRTVLEMLAEHENQRASDLTQVIQSRDGWGECRRLVEDYISSNANLNSSSDSGIDRPEGDRSPREVVWRPLPGNSSAVGRTSTRGGASSPSDSSGIYQPPSLSAEFVNLHDVDDHASTISISTRDDFDVLSQASPCSTYSASTYSAPSARWGSRLASDGRVPRFPLTSPNTKARHNGARRTADTLPASTSQLRTNTLPSRATILPAVDGRCVYRPPPGADGRRVVQDNGTVHTYNPALSYDNVPQSRQWAHECCDPHQNPPLPPAIKLKVRSDGTQTLPTPRPRTRPSALNTFSSIQEDSSSNRSSHEREPSHDSMNSLPRTSGAEVIRVRQGSVASNGSNERSPCPTTKPPVVPRLVARWSRTSDRDREESLGLGNQLDTREGSAFSFACSTLDRRSNTPPSAYKEGRAPLALPEELTGSTSTSIMSSSLSPERTLSNFDRDASLADESSVTMQRSDSQTEPTMLPLRRITRDTMSADTTADDTLSSIGGDPTDDDNQQLPSPYTSQSRIFDALCGQESLRLPRRPASPGSPCTVCSESTVASSCSLPVISQISTTPPSVASPRREKVEKQYSTDTASSLEVKLRSNNNGFAGNRMPKQHRKNEEGRSLNESAEWNKINEIMESFGGAICRESVFARQYEPQVAVYLRDRRSRALTIQKRESAEPPAERRLSTTHSISTTHSQRSSQSPSKPLGICDWLNVVVGTPNPKATEVGRILESNGFDRSTQLKISLDRIVMTEMGIDKSIQHQILSYLDTLEAPKENANSFNYVSDWLCSLELTDYLGNFVSAGFRSMLIVRAAELEQKRLKEMGITLLGHVRRLLGSLALARDEERRQTVERKQQLRKQLGDERTASASPTPSLPTTDSRVDLVNSGATFSAHYLGSMEISNIDGTEESRRAMNKLKRGIREIAKVPHVQLEISVSGVKVFDASSKRSMASHAIGHIQIVCQDERDLNCFAYITQEGERNFAHVFCVLTADVATEIIMTLGNAFELAYNMQSGQFGSLEEIVDI